MIFSAFTFASRAESNEPPHGIFYSIMSLIEWHLAHGRNVGLAKPEFGALQRRNEGELVEGNGTENFLSSRPSKQAVVRPRTMNRKKVDGFCRGTFGRSNFGVP